MNTMKWLLRREFWENKGGFFWAPVVSAGVFLLLNVLAIAVAYAAAGRAHIKIGLIKLEPVLKTMDPKILEETVAGIDLTVMFLAAMIGVVSSIVVFFYSLGALYDERRDRSILFWKSLPISDRDTVLSKALSALLVAPAIGLATGAVTAIGTLLIAGLFLAFNGQNMFGIFFIDAHPFSSVLKVLSVLPLYALWALPSVGWLMLCSAWARSKPFLWAVGTPIGVGVLVSWFDLMQNFAQPDSWFWTHVVGRMLLSVVPGGWIDATKIEGMERGPEGPADVLNMLTLGNLYSPLGTPELWVGAAAGIAMLVLATRMRRWRDEA